MFETMRTWLHTSDIRAYPLYSATIFLSAFLLFQVQPMVGRFLLPFFGGATAVWAASLVFFTGVLFFGYLYVYAISNFSGNRQTTVHAAVLLVAAATVIGTLIFADSTYPSFDWVFDATSAPALQVVLALIVCIGIPYFLLSTTGPLLQQWYAAETRQEPYHLYALSNFGSLLALGTYPFIMEPLFGLSQQQFLWSLLFILFVVLLATTTRSYRAKSIRLSSEDPTHIGVVPYARLLSWLVLAAIPAVMLVATTSRITQIIAPVPFIWVVPLALYLLSFILAFRGWGAGGLTPFLVIIGALASYAYLDWTFETVPKQIIANLALFFFGALYCHSLLYKLRPPQHLSSFYYVWISLGGAAGTLLVTLVAPVLFVDILEFSLGVAALAALAVLGYPASVYIRDEFARKTKIVKGALLISVIVFSGHYIYAREDTAIYSSRNFYGVVHVYDLYDMRSLNHGTTMHGTQFLDPEMQDIPTSYYSSTSGVGLAIIDAQSKSGGMQPVTVGVIGLGTGTLAAYCGKNDTFVYYEIDERIGLLANSYFTYLPGCAKAEVHYGDGRLSLAKELAAGKRGDFDVLAVDAFSDDTIPVHLLTKEAIELYLKHLRSDQSIIAIHTSNRFFELAPIVMRIAGELGLSSAIIDDFGEETEGASSSQWVLVAKDGDVLQQQVFSSVASEPYGEAPLWTDDYANVFAALDLNSLRPWGRE